MVIYFSFGVFGLLVKTQLFVGLCTRQNEHFLFRFYFENFDMVEPSLEDNLYK